MPKLPSAAQPAHAPVHRSDGADSPGSRHDAGILMVLAAAFLWSTSGVVLKEMTLPSVAIAGIRAGIAGLALSPFLTRLTLGWNPLRWDWRMAPLLGGYTATLVFFTAAVRLTTAANAIALIYTAPAWVFLFSCLAARRVAWRLSVPVAIILIGLGIILAEPAAGRGAAGNLLALVGGLGYGLFTFFVARLNQRPIALVSLCNLFAAAILFLLAHDAFLAASPTWSVWATLAYLGVFQIALGHLFFVAALARIPATQASILALAEPMLNPIWVFFFIGEMPSRFGLAGLAVILGGVCVDLWLRRGSLP
jgi:drug/metabolite transporter (DMT)-like permease